jgi:iron complex outermembrane receptor protein
MNIIRWILPVVFVLTFADLQAQDRDTTSIERMTKEQLLSFSKEDLSELPLKDLMYIVNKLKLTSVEELYELILNPTVKSASKTEEDYQMSPLDAIVLSRDEIEKAGALTIAEALRLVPGLIVRQKTNGNFDVHIRGNDNMPPGKYLFDSENTISLVMIDDRPVYNYFQGGTFWEALPIGIHDIERIEVIKGPATALYGPNAMSGVINIITKKNVNKKHNFHASAQYGTQETGNAGLSYTYNNMKNFSARLSANYTHMDRNAEDYFDLVDYRYVPIDTLHDLVGEVDSRYPDPSLSLESAGINAWLNYQPVRDLDLQLTLGTQESRNQSIYLDINNVSYTMRKSMTNYADFQGRYKGLMLHLSYRGGTEDNAYGFNGYKFDVENLLGVLEYDFQIDKFKFQPGISYSLVSFDDRPYLDPEDRLYGPLFNDNKTIQNFAYYLRSEYKPTECLKFIAALRNDHYSVVDKISTSYQFAATYRLSEKDLIRIVYSKANRGPSMFDYHIDYESELITYVGFIPTNRYTSNDDLKLPEMNMTEIGYRHRIRKNLRLDFTFFRSVSKNYSIAVTDTVKINGRWALSTQKENVNLKANQFGLTANLDWMLHSKVRLNVFSTVQTTYLNSFFTAENYNYNNDDIIIGQEHDLKHENTPSFYGGFVLDYCPVKDFNINLNSYYYSQQNFFSIDGITPIEENIVMNIKASYNFSKNLTAYMNARNVLNEGKKEFIFSDYISSLYLFGLNLKL